MCGFVGVKAGVSGFDIVQIRSRCAKALWDISYRGPDSEHFYYDGSLFFGGHRRLSISDSQNLAADQPMLSHNRDVVILFNGQIYNAEELCSFFGVRIQFKTNSDTERLLELYSRVGPELFPYLRGIFAAVFYHPLTKKLVMVRDQLGVKPLYYSLNEYREISFASTPKSLSKVMGNDDHRLSFKKRTEVAFKLFGSCPLESTPFDNQVALSPGTYIVFDENNRSSTREYFNIKDFWLANAGGSVQPSKEALRTTLRQAVLRNMSGDAQGGIFTSSGFDSTLLVSQITQHPHNTLIPISIDFESRQFNTSEIRHTKFRLNRYGIEERLKTKVFERKDFFSVYPHLLETMTHPSIDSINTFFASLFARNMGAKYVLSGIGGDEIFGSYRSQYLIPIFKKIKDMTFLKSSARPLDRRRILNSKRKRLLVWPNSTVDLYLYIRLYSLLFPLGEDSQEYDLANEIYWSFRDQLSALCEGMNDDLAISFLEFVFYLKGQLLVDSDSASMANSLELRVPLLDLDFMAEVLRYRGRGHIGKRKFATLLSDDEMLIESAVSKKHGFSTPSLRWVGEYFNVNPEMSPHRYLILDKICETYAAN